MIHLQLQKCKEDGYAHHDGYLPKKEELHLIRCIEWHQHSIRQFQVHNASAKPQVQRNRDFQLHQTDIVLDGKREKNNQSFRFIEISPRNQKHQLVGLWMNSKVDAQGRCFPPLRRDQSIGLKAKAWTSNLTTGS